MLNRTKINVETIITMDEVRKLYAFYDDFQKVEIV